MHVPFLRRVLLLVLMQGFCAVSEILSAWVYEEKQNRWISSGPMGWAQKHGVGVILRQEGVLLEISDAALFLLVWPCSAWAGGRSLHSSRSDHSCTSRAI